MLFHYLDHKRKESSAQLHATYLVSGKFVDKGQAVSHVVFIFTEMRHHCFDWLFFIVFVFQSHKVSVVREDKLEGVWRLFPAAVFSINSSAFSPDAGKVEWDYFQQTHDE